MDGGYVLVHVLEAVVPGQDLGDEPVCEVSLGATAIQCPIPSTLQSENIALPTHGDSDPIVHVRALSTQRRDVGLVVVPVNTLVPLEVWNVWYAMDEGLDDVDDKSPEETPKMHLLLQYVSPEAAAEEAPQLREMRAQDFLLRALQQLNASLEAKVLGHQSRSFGGTLPVGDASSMAGGASFAGEAASALLQPSLGDGFSNSSRSMFADASGYPAGAPYPSPPTPAAASFQRATGSTVTTTAPPSPFRPQRATPPAPCDVSSPKLTPKEIAQQAKWEDMLRARVEPYEKVIAGFEEKQRMYADQEAKVRDLLRSHAESEERCRALRAQLDAAYAQHNVDIEAQQELVKQANASRANGDQQVQELRQEVALRLAHEDSLQKRVALLESELSVVHQKCVIVDSIEQEADAFRTEVQQLKDVKQQLQEQVDEKAREIGRQVEELWKLRQDHARELNKLTAQLSEEQKIGDKVRDDLHRCQDLLRDKSAEHALLGERLEQALLSVSTLEGEVASCRSMLDKERAHRKELERRLGEQELKRLDSALDEHRQTVRELRQEVAQLRLHVQHEKGRSGALEEEMATARREASKAQQQELDARQSLANQAELRQEVKAANARSEELRARLKAMQDDTRKMTEHYERELGEHVRAERSLSAERDEHQRKAGELRAEALRLQHHVEELRAQQDQTGRSLAVAREAADKASELERLLHEAQEECRGHHHSRTEMHGELQRMASKFQEDAFSQDRRVEELQATLEERNNEIKVLMHRVQELSSKYTPLRSDSVDVVLAKWVNGYKPAVPFFRLATGLYLFGRRQVICKISNDKPVFRVGGGFIGFDKFLELYASEELERLLDYETDERTGEPKFLEAQKVRQAMEDSGQLDDLRERAEILQASRGEGPRPAGAVDRRRPLN